MSSPAESRLILLFALFGSEHAPDALEWIQTLAVKMFGRAVDIVIRADSDANESSEGRSAESLNLLKSDNYAADFSAWSVCLEEYRRFHFQENDIVLFANDSFHRNFGTGILKYFLELKTARLRQDLENSIVGVVDDFPAPVTVCGRENIEWVRSNFFMISARNLSLIEPICLTHQEAKQIFNEEPGTPFFKPDAPLSLNYRVYMQRWLFGTVDPNFPEYQIEWLRCESLSEQNRSAFQRKMRAILSEHSMSFRAQEKGLTLVNVNPRPWDSERHTANIYERHRLKYAPLSLEHVRSLIPSS